jgi:hypothetical protein
VRALTGIPTGIGLFFEQRSKLLLASCWAFAAKKVRRAAREWHEQNFKLDVSFQRFRFRA